MGIWKNRSKRDQIRSRFRHKEFEREEPHVQRVETLEDKELEELVKEIQEQKPNKK